MAAKHILIVEDDHDVAQSVAEVLEASGYGTGIAANGLEALDYLQTHTQTDLILLDMMMPVMDGWQFRREQARLESVADVPVIVVSAVARDRLAEIDADAVIPKPVDLDELLKQITVHCSRKH